MPDKTHLADLMAGAELATTPERSTDAAPVQAFRSGKTSLHPRRLSLDLDEVQFRALRLATATDSIAMAERLRGLIALWMQDPAIAQRVIELATPRNREVLPANMRTPVEPKERVR